MGESPSAKTLVVTKDEILIALSRLAHQVFVLNLGGLKRIETSRSVLFSEKNSLWNLDQV